MSPVALSTQCQASNGSMPRSSATEQADTGKSAKFRPDGTAAPLSSTPLPRWRAKVAWNCSHPSLTVVRTTPPSRTLNGDQECARHARERPARGRQDRKIHASASTVLARAGRTQGPNRARPSHPLPLPYGTRRARHRRGCPVGVTPTWGGALYPWAPGSGMGADASVLSDGHSRVIPRAPTGHRYNQEPGWHSSVTSDTHE